jgi:hypothetical protein
LGGGFADGGEYGDNYYINTIRESIIRDSGGFGNDYVYLQRVANFSDLMYYRQGDDLLISSSADKAEVITATVRLDGWYSGHNTIEYFATADGFHFSGSFFA